MNKKVTPEFITAMAAATDACASLTALQTVAREIYGVYDREKALLWMCEEVGELLQAIRRGRPIDRISGEYGDLLTWVICLSNILDVSLASVAAKAFEKELLRQEASYGRLKYWS